MVGNTRTVMMCGLLVLAGGLALGSRPGSAEAGMGTAATVPALVPWVVERFAPAPEVVAPLPAVPLETPIDTGTVGLEGHREPRGPRDSHEAGARTAR